MKINQLISGFPVMLSNQEQAFLDKHNTNVALMNLTEHELWLAQNLVRKGVYDISKDDQTLIKK